MTSLADGQRVSKTDGRLEAYGTADELNSFVGLLRAEVQQSTMSVSEGNNDIGNFAATVDTQLDWIQNRLFDLGASLSCAGGEWIVPEYALKLEQWMDIYQKNLTPLRAFVLPAGNKSVALAHICRTVTRRLERCILRLNYDSSCANKMNNPADNMIKDNNIVFVNRLSDYFFILSRALTEQMKITPVIWQK